MVTDGALGSRTAAMLAPYSDDAKHPAFSPWSRKN